MVPAPEPDITSNLIATLRKLAPSVVQTPDRPEPQRHLEFYDKAAFVITIRQGMQPGHIDLICTENILPT